MHKAGCYWNLCPTQFGPSQGYVTVGAIEVTAG